MLSTDKAWERFGREDPYFGVLADARFTADNIAEHLDDFFNSGRAFVRHLIQRYEKHFGPLPRGRALDHGCGVGRVTLPLSEHFGSFPSERALDFGCGVGRLTFPLAGEFSTVLGLDISPSMLTEAEANAVRLGARNVAFALAGDGFTNASGEFDFVNSVITLQHIPVRRGLPVISRLIEMVRPGGGFHIHFSVRTDALPSRALWWASHHIPGVKIWQNVFAGRHWNAPAMQMNNYPLNRIVVQLAALGVSEFLVSTEHHSKFLTCSVIGKRPEHR
jgi:2-polyprenyl-3-methyl-5-hydroxy-6-metoxy-1,4-benzoquinol methylase